jgi:predicted hydrolase (HD superfamily)
MTAHEALWLMKVQLQRTEQNIQAVKVLEDIVKSVDRLRIDDEPNYTLEHLFGDVEYDLSKLTLVDEPTYTLDEALVEVFGTEAEHIKNHMAKVGTKDIQELEKVEQSCARYDLVEEE